MRPSFTAWATDIEDGTASWASCVAEIEDGGVDMDSAADNGGAARGVGAVDTTCGDAVVSGEDMGCLPMALAESGASDGSTGRSTGGSASSPL